MRNSMQDAVVVTPLLDLAARGITDPVLRLRFLQFAAPVPDEPRVHSVVRIAVIPGLVAALFTVTLLVRPGARARSMPVAAAPRVDAPPVPAAPPGAPANVWKVEDAHESEVYSNGLRIDNRFVVSNHPRSSVAGIVFHTTESKQAPFEPEHNGVLKRIGESLIEYVQRKRAYNFLIDRFGRVYRIVAEGDAANHAGHSVWADETGVYLNLNESFLGVSFEAETQPGQAEATVTPAQVRSAAMLTEMLRSRYAIPAGNCVTHAQVSVNPSNMQVGYHTDWSSSFPFEQVGLPNNYARPSPSIAMFGFAYDSAFLQRAGTQLYAGMEAGERQLREAARKSGMTLAGYRQTLRKRYQEKQAAMRRSVANGDDGA